MAGELETFRFPFPNLTFQRISGGIKAESSQIFVQFFRPIRFDLGRLGGAYQFGSSAWLTPGGETAYYDDQKERKGGVDPINHLPELVEVGGALLPDWRFIAILV